MSGVERFVGRVGGLAIALGLGAAAATVPWLASADAGSLAWDGSSLLGLDPSALLGPAASDPFGLDLVVSYNGQTLIDWGTGASATSAHGGLAIAFGDGSTADAGIYTSSQGFQFNGDDDFAFANGSGSTAVATGGLFNSATATNGGIAHAGVYDDDGVSGNGGHLDSATANGSGSLAEAMSGSQNTATATNGGTADSGFFNGDSTVTQSAFGGSSDAATANGNGSLAAAFGAFSDTAKASGADSHAYSGGISGTEEFPVQNDNNYAAAFEGSTANATAFSGQTVISPFLDSGLTTSQENSAISDIYAAVDAVYQNAGNVLKEVPSGFPSNELSGINGQSEFITAQQQILTQLESDQQTMFTNANPTVLVNLDKELLAPANDVYSNTTAYASAVFTDQGAGQQLESALGMVHADFSAVATDFNVLFGGILAEISGLSGLPDLFAL